MKLKDVNTFTGNLFFVFTFFFYMSFILSSAKLYSVNEDGGKREGAELSPVPLSPPGGSTRNNPPQRKSKH